MVNASQLRIGGLCLIAIVLALSGGGCGSNRYDVVIPYQVDGRWGLAGSDRSPITAPTYDFIGPTTKTLICASRQERWGYIDRRGRTVISRKKAWHPSR